MKYASDDEVRQATDNVTNAITEALTASINGHPSESNAPVTSCSIILCYGDGNVSTSIAGLLNKSIMYGALVEAILSINELDRAMMFADIQAVHNAQAEKLITEKRTDN